MVVLGKVVAPYGVCGWVRIHPFADDPLAWGDLPAWWLGREGSEDWLETRLLGCRPQGKALVCQFAGVLDRSAAEVLKGMLVAAPREALPAAGKDEFYWDDLIGLQVINTADEPLGRVDGLLETGANDVLRVVSPDGVERLLPFVGQVVLGVDKENGAIRVDWGSDW